MGGNLDSLSSCEMAKNEFPVPHPHDPCARCTSGTRDRLSYRKTENANSLFLRWKQKQLCWGLF